MLKNWKALLLALVLVDFTSLTVWAAMNESVGDAFASIAATPWFLQASLDLAIAAIIALVFIWRDAKEEGINPVPYVVATALLGSIGLLSYGVRRLWISTPARAQSGRAAAPA